MDANEMDYIATGPNCKILWVVSGLKNNGAGLSISDRPEAKCHLSIEEQMLYRKALLANVLKETNRSIIGFTWVSMDRGDGTDAYAKRLGAATLRSKRWDTKNNRPLDPKQHPHTFVENLLRKENIFSELTKIFESHDYALEVSGVEKLLTQPGPLKLPMCSWVFFDVKKKVK